MRQVIFPFPALRHSRKNLGIIVFAQTKFKTFLRHSRDKAVFLGLFKAFKNGQTNLRLFKDPREPWPWCPTTARMNEWKTSVSTWYPTTAHMNKWKTSVSTWCPTTARMNEWKTSVSTCCPTTARMNEWKTSVTELPTLASKKEEHCRAHRTNKFQAQ